MARRRGPTSSVSLLVLVALLTSTSFGSVEPAAITGGRDAAIESARELSAAFARAVRDLVCEDLGATIASVRDGLWSGHRPCESVGAIVREGEGVGPTPELREALLDLPPPSFV